MINVRLNEYNGRKSLSLIRDSVMKINENIPLANSLHEWFENQNNDSINKFLSKKEMSGVECSTLKDIQSVLPLSSINTMGVCFDVSELNIFTYKKNEKELKKWLITLIDKSTANNFNIMER